jgi:NAD(P)-dependent dehydrogenase (short-subunit alcohol dehydrogenase family)
MPDPDPTSRPVAVITGGGGDLAAAMRSALTTEGWHVLAPGRAELDVRSTRSVDAFFAGVSRLDLLVNQAAILRDGPVFKMTAADFHEVLDTCLTGAFRCARAALKIMTEQGGGHLLQIGSFSGSHGAAGQANYAAAKAALAGLTKSLTLEYGGHGIRANLVLPGFLETRMTRHLLADPERGKRILAAHSLGRLNTAQDAARFVIALHQMSHVSGQVFQLDSRIG